MKYFIGVFYDPDKETLKEATLKLINLCVKCGGKPTKIKKETQTRPDGSVYYLLTTETK
jgi:hypothetical protein